MSVSIVITCFNLEPYIAEAIESVLAQDWQGPLDVVVVDDCSTDASPEIVRRYESVRYVRTESNGGVLLATLRGVEEAKGDVVFFLDGDDRWHAAKLSDCMSALERNPRAVLVTHDLRFVDANGRPIERASRPSEVLDPLPEHARSEAIINGLMRQDDYIWLGSAWGVRRDLGRMREFVDWARKLPDPANTYQDWPMAMWLASLPDAEAAYVPKKLFDYRLHEANYSGDTRTAVTAIRNFKRTFNTLAAMYDLAVMRRVPSDVLEILRERLRAYEYLIRLYSDDRRGALRLLPRALADFRRQKRVSKELIRFLGVQALGAERFGKLLQSRRTAAA